MPDFGFLNAGETVDNARRIIRAVNIPVIIDIDTGYGNPLTVWRLVSDLESMGADWSVPGGSDMAKEMWSYERKGRNTEGRLPTEIKSCLGCT